MVFLMANDGSQWCTAQLHNDKMFALPALTEIIGASFRDLN